VREAIIRWEVFDTPQANISAADLPGMALCTRTPFIIGLGEGHRGKYFHYSLRWSGSKERPDSDVKYVMVL
jgi:hypothetical protein